MAKSISFQPILYQINFIVPPIANNNFISEIYYNPRLEGKIALIEPYSRVDFSYWNLIDQDMSIITKKIIINKQCTELCLCGNKITSEGTLILALKLFNNSTLNTLDLSYNSIGDDGVYSLSQMLLPNHYSSLKILSLNKNGISNDGVAYLAAMLQTNQTLTELSLSDNEIGNEGVKQLANVLTYRNRTLEVLVLSFNIFITDLCLDYLLRMLDNNQALEKFSMNDCNLSYEGKMELREEAERKINFEIVV
jgi:Ran GTPase-activating protein (RanGAP) involved in mRNA processing and transport